MGQRVGEDKVQVQEIIELLRLPPRQESRVAAAASRADSSILQVGGHGRRRQVVGAAGIKLVLTTLFSSFSIFLVPPKEIPSLPHIQVSSSIFSVSLNFHNTHHFTQVRISDYSPSLLPDPHTSLGTTLSGLGTGKETAS